MGTRRGYVPDPCPGGSGWGIGRGCGTWVGQGVPGSCTTGGNLGANPGLDVGSDLGAGEFAAHPTRRETLPGPAMHRWIAGKRALPNPGRRPPCPRVATSARIHIGVVMNNLDKRISDAERDLDAFAHGLELLQTPADKMHALLVERADELMGCTEDSPEEAELATLTDAIEAYEAVRWPDGKEPGGKG